jgi:hypothetical protein
MFKKKLVLSLLSLAMAFGVVSTTASAAKVNVSVQVDGNTIKFPDEQPYFEDNRVMIPIRFVSEALGAVVEFEKTKTDTEIRRVVKIELAGKKIDMPVNSDVALVDDQTVKLEVPARMQGNRVYVPIRFVSEALGANVKWNADKKIVIVTTGADQGNEEPKEPTKPVEDKDSIYQAYEFKTGFTSLAKDLFVNNMKVTNGKLTFTLPKGASGRYHTKDGDVTLLKAGQSYTYSLGEGKGYISFAFNYEGKLEGEGYGVFLDSKNNENLAKEFGTVTNDAIVVNYNSDGKRVAGTLTEVIAHAKSLK